MKNTGLVLYRPGVLFIIILPLLIVFNGGCSEEIQIEVDNPYEEINWENIHFLHSGSHLHSRQQDRWEEIYEMGIRHFALSNYYPSKPIWPLPDEFLEDRDDIVASPNAEHHSATDHNLHFTTPGSFYTKGYGRGYSIPFETGWEEGAPFRYTFDDLNLFDPDSETPGEGVYRVDLRREAIHPDDAGMVEVYLTLDGAELCDRRTFEKIDDGRIQNMKFRGEGEDNIYFCTASSEVKMRVDFDPEITQFDRLRVMQGVHRPWRKAFYEALDGNRTDENGNPIEGLQYPEGGGIIINHPRHPVENSIEMLDFDERVLGVEVWNHRRWFGLENDAPHMRYYDHWEEILGTGRRAYGFFVKDHYLAGRGRNILLVPEPNGRTSEQREREALIAYRQGQFFGSLGAWDIVDDENHAQLPYDYSSFYFRNIELIRSERGYPVAVQVAVDGHNEELRPNLQIRFITDKGAEQIVNGEKQARFELPGAEEEMMDRLYVRVEAFAWPETHNNGEILTAQQMEKKNVYQIARVHDRRGYAGINDIDPAGEQPIGTVEMIFSQPVRFIQNTGR